ncbi:MAG: tRNA (adenosine(37)-N6)-threonylcarbamoyltransferase complex dimerization subunit type 1 TsaB [Proteobacteria bacterium]|nr:tRNA (adenosine(37)-N6)-threonylcarbamoyltransferase complex dimerization subunit type 1 TsaB [Pseudomonadota bacterium]
MYSLAYDTTAAQCAVVLKKDNDTLGSYVQYMDFGQAEVLIPQIEKLLQEGKLSFSDLDLVVVCVGPGSFTGVRAGIAAARAFSIAAPDLCVAGISAFEAYARTLEEEENKITPPQAGNYEDILPQLRHRKVSLVGDGVERFLSRPSGLSLHVIKMLEALPVEQLAACGIKHFYDKDADFPKPLYLRAPDVSAPKA